MSQDLDSKMLVADCPAKSKVLGIFGKRCAYLTTRCSMQDWIPVNGCIVYNLNNKHSKSRTPAYVPGEDHHERHLGIGANDHDTMRRHTYG